MKLQVETCLYRQNVNLLLTQCEELIQLLTRWKAVQRIEDVRFTKVAEKMIVNSAENIEYAREEWYPIVKEQEEKLKFDTFTREDARKLGECICELGKTKYHSNVVVKIVMDGLPVYTYFMEGTGLKNDWWMKCKYNTVCESGTSSMLALLDRVVGNKKMEEWCSQTASYFLCGGGVPVRLKNGNTAAVVLVSAMTHEEDHQLIIDAISQILEVQVPSVLDIE